MNGLPSGSVMLPKLKGTYWLTYTLIVEGGGVSRTGGPMFGGTGLFIETGTISLAYYYGLWVASWNVPSTDIKKFVDKIVRSALRMLIYPPDSPPGLRVAVTYDGRG